MKTEYEMEEVWLPNPQSQQKTNIFLSKDAMTNPSNVVGTRASNL
jgi:hypothetical protein